MADVQKKIRLLLVDDHPLTREGIRACLDAAPHIEVIAEAADGREAVRRAHELAPDLVVMDVNMPRLNGLAATATLQRECPAVRVLVLTMHDHPEYIVEIIRAGARGYVSKDISPAELIRAIEKVAAGEAYFGLAETLRYLRRYSSASPCVMAEPTKALTSREREVIGYIGQGMTSREISGRMKVAQRTVETYRERLMRKLDVHSTSELRFYAAAHGLVTQRKPKNAFEIDSGDCVSMRK
jgi:DNA-binding NarL/FixJ family response regulator